MPHQLVLNYFSSKAKFVFNSNTSHTFQREICCNDTFKLLLKTLLRELLTSKGEILSCKSVKPCKNQKNSWTYFVRTRLIWFKFPTLPMQRSNSPLPGHNAQSNTWGIPGRGGGMLKFRIDRRIKAVHVSHNLVFKCNIYAFCTWRFD